MTDIPKFAAHHRASDDDWQTLDDHPHGVARWARRVAAKLGLPAHGELIGLLTIWASTAKHFSRT